MSRKYTRLSEEQQSEVCRRYKAGDSLSMLERSFDVSMTSIRNALIRHQVPIRTLSEGMLGERNHFFGRHHSLETRKRLSIVNTGRSHSDKTKETLSIMKKGNKYWLGKQHAETTKRKMSRINKGKRLSELTKQRISEAKKGKCLSEETRKKMSRTHMGMPSWNKGKRLSEDARRKMSEVRKGDRNGNWRGGIAYKPYCSKFNAKLKERIRNRDSRTCQLCGVEENGKRLAIHHVHYDKPNCNPDLISLCTKCHAKANGNREYYESYFMGILKARGLA